MIRRILVPLDGSRTAEAILLHVRRVLLGHEAEVILLRTHTTFAPDFHFSPPGGSAEAGRYIRRTTFALVNDGLRARGLVRAGDAAEQILQTIVKEEISLVAMSTHGRSGIRRWALGSVAEKVVRASPIPVLLLRSFPSEPRRADSEGCLERAPFRNVLIPLDESAASAQAISFVKDFVRPLDANVLLLNVRKRQEPESSWDPPLPSLEAATGELVRDCIPVKTETRKGDPAGEILKACKDHSIDLLAMTTHGRSGPARWILGSVTEKVLRAATVPLLIVRLHARRSSAPSAAAQ